MIKKISIIFVFLGILTLMVSCNFKTETFRVSFETNEGTPIHTIVLERDSTLTNIPPTTKDGFVFEGWFKEEAFTNQWLDTDKVEKSITLYAKWSETE